jgi:hypothetical protein
MGGQQNAVQIIFGRSGTIRLFIPEAVMQQGRSLTRAVIGKFCLFMN